MDELLSPYRVLDLTDDKGMLCGKILAYMGADVIKCEPPGGDPCRKFGPFLGDIPDPERSLFWFDSNAGKRSITLSLKTEEGKEVFRELVRTADVLLESFEPGYMTIQGLGYDELSKLNPRLIMVAISPFGQKGPKAHYRTTELTRWASTGVMYCTGDPDRPPNWIAVPQSRIHGGIEAAFGALTAINYRGISGEGQYVDVSMQASAIDALMDTPEMWLMDGRDYRRQSFANARWNGVVQRFALPCKDGHVVFYTIGGGLLASAEHLGRVREWMKEEGKAPEWFLTLDFVRDYDSAALTQELVDRVEGTMESFLRTKTRAEIYERALKDQLIAAPIQNAADVWEDKQLRARNFWTEWEHAEGHDKVVYPGALAIFGVTPLKLKRPAPRLGEHNEEVYVRELGMSREKLVFLKEIGAI